MFKKILSKVGVGAAKVETVLENDKLVRGQDESIKGEIRITGGNTEQQINKIFLELYTHYYYEYATDHDGDGVVDEVSESSSRFVLHHHDVEGEMTLSPNEELSYDFEIPLPLETPVTKGVTVTLKTDLDVSWSRDPKDHDKIEVLPDPATEMLLKAAEGLDFVERFESGRCYEIDNPTEAPYVQTFMYENRGTAVRQVEYLELMVVPYVEGIEVIMSIERGGFFVEAFDMGEHQLRFEIAHDEEFGAQELQDLLHEALDY